MKSLIRWSATLGLVGSMVLGSWWVTELPVLALPEEQILQKLQSVPVFILMDNQNQPLIVTAENKEGSIIILYISQQDAQADLEKLKTTNAELANKSRVMGLPLASAYKSAKDAQKQGEKLSFSFIPRKAEVEAAKKIFSEKGQEYQGGVPLFCATEGNDKGCVGFEKDNQPVIPLFFEEQPLQQLLDNIKKQKPELASTIKIEVIPLESVIATLEKSDDKNLNSLSLEPTQESIKFIQQVRQQQQNQPNQSQTTPPPANAQPSPQK